MGEVSVYRNRKVEWLASARERPSAAKLDDDGSGAVAGRVEAASACSPATHRYDEVRWVPGSSTACPVVPNAVPAGIRSAG